MTDCTFRLMEHWWLLFIYVHYKLCLRLASLLLSSNSLRSTYSRTNQSWVTSSQKNCIYHRTSISSWSISSSRSFLISRLYLNWCVAFHMSFRQHVPWVQQQARQNAMSVTMDPDSSKSQIPYWRVQKCSTRQEAIVCYGIWRPKKDVYSEGTCWITGNRIKKAISKKGFTHWF
jgi:hypothetical protein